MPFFSSKAKPAGEPTKEQLDSANKLVKNICDDETLRKSFANTSVKLMNNEPVRNSALRELNKVNDFKELTDALKSQDAAERLEAVREGQAERAERAEREAARAAARDLEEDAIAKQAGKASLPKAAVVQANVPEISRATVDAAIRSSTARVTGPNAGGGGRRRTKNAKYYNKRRRTKRRRSKRRRSNKRRA